MKIGKLILLILMSICSACSSATPSKAEISANAEINEARNNRIENTIASENKLWTELSIDSYQIEVNNSSNWVNYTVKLTVKNNIVVAFEANCGYAIIEGDSFCKETLPTISPNDHTIQALFDGLKKSRKNFEEDLGEYVSASWGESISITFDPQYHYPQLVKFDSPDVYDEEYTIEVLSFKILQK